MMKAASETWLCPLCARVICPFGTMPCDDTCPNRAKAHITGAWYLKATVDSAGEAIGIAAISDESKEE